jgi:hypothetical protein
MDPFLETAPSGSDHRHLRILIRRELLKLDIFARARIFEIGLLAAFRCFG